MLGRAAVLVLVLTSAAGAQPAPPADPAPPPAIPAPPPPTPTTPPSTASPAPPPEMPPRPPVPSWQRERFGASLFGILGTGPKYWLHGAWAIDGGVTLLHAPVRLRAHVLATLVGGVVQSDWSGPFRRYGAGLELRGCAEGIRLCGFVDVDVGFQQLTLRSSLDVEGEHRGLYLGPRIGFDAGFRFRFRLAIEVARQLTDGSFTSRGLSLGLAFQH